MGQLRSPGPWPLEPTTHSSKLWLLFLMFQSACKQNVAPWALQPLRSCLRAVVLLGPGRLSRPSHKHSTLVKDVRRSVGIRLCALAPFTHQNMILVQAARTSWSAPLLNSAPPSVSDTGEGGGNPTRGHPTLSTQLSFLFLCATTGNQN